MSYSVGKPGRLGGRWFICISGDPGVGKTTLCAGAPNPLWLDTGSETMVLSYTESVKDELPPVICLDDPFQLDEICWDIRNDKLSCGTLIVDNFTDLQGIQLDFSSERLKTGRDRGGVTVPILEDYNISTVLCRKAIRKHFMRQDFPCNVIVVCHRLEVKEKGSESISKVRVSLTEKLAGTLNGAVDANLVLSRKINSVKKTTERILRANPTNLIEAKNRIGLPDEFPAEDLWEELEKRK